MSDIAHRVTPPAATCTLAGKSAGNSSAPKRLTTAPPPVPPLPLTIAPFTPEDVRRRHHAFVASDTRFAAACRLLAALWRADHDLPAGTHVTTDAKGKTHRLTAGWRLRRDAAQAGATFLSPEIRAYAREALLFREPGAVWNEDRLWKNLLASQALTLNLLAPLALDTALATRVWQQLLPGFVHQVTGLRFEHSPGRFVDHYFGDATAFDAVIDCVTPDGEPAVVTAELKFTEDLVGPTATLRARYNETAVASGLFVDPLRPTLRRPGFEQLRREHVMTQLMLQHGLAARGCFVLIAPALNRRAQAVAKLYAAELLDPAGDTASDHVSFVSHTLEEVHSAMASAGGSAIARPFFDRYLDLHRVARCALDGDGPLPTPPAAPAALSPPPHSLEPFPVRLDHRRHSPRP